MIPFNVPPEVGSEIDYVSEAIENKKLSGDGPFTKKCENLIQEKFHSKLVLLTPSCTAALEMAAILINIQPGDEVIMPSYTFVSTANAFVLRGAKVVFVDIHPDTMNIDETKIENAITSNTKAIVPVHYAGVACEMDTIMDIAERYKLWVIEDAAQGVMSTYKRKPLGSIGHLGCFSFHETKNYTSGGEGGALLVNDESFSERAQIIREKGTNRAKFFKGYVDKYTWVDIGSSFLASELQAAYLLCQLDNSQKLLEQRLFLWHRYQEAFSELEKKGLLERPSLKNQVEHNGHIYFLKLRDLSQRSDFISKMKNNEIMCTFHYLPLHTTEFGSKCSYFCGQDLYTSKESERLVRLPIWNGLSNTQQKYIIQKIISYFEIV